METITNSYEAIEMLKEVKANALENGRDTVIKDICLDSLCFVIDEAVKCIDRLRLFRGDWH